MKTIVAGNVKSKTSWVAVALIVIGGIEQGGMLELVPDEYKGIAISVIGAVMLVLRNLSTNAIADKTDDGDSNDQAA